MKIEKQYTGIWYLVDEPEKQLFGTLNIEEDLIELDLLDHLSEKNKEFIVHGFTSDGKKITLYKCHISGSGKAFPGISTMSVSAIYFFLGDHLLENDLNFNTAIITLSDLDEWVDINGFQNFSNNDNKISVEYENPEPIVFYDNDGIKLIIQFMASAPMFKPHTTCTIKQETVIFIKSETKVSLLEFWHHVSTIDSFLALAYFASPKIEEIVFKIDDKRILMTYIGQHRFKTKKKTHHREFIFTYNDVQNRFVDIYGRWTEVYKNLTPVIGILIETFRGNSQLVENVFLNLIQAVEAFHRRSRPDEKIPKEEFNNKVEEILAACPPQHQSWLQETLKYQNENNLRFRLNCLFNEIDKELLAHLYPNHEELIKDSINNRNYLTHYDSGLEKKKKSLSELAILKERLKILLIILLLKETGFNDDEVKKFVKNGSYFLFNHLISKDSPFPL